MEHGARSPLVDFFRRGEVARDIRLLAAQGALAPRAHEQLALLMLLVSDQDPEIVASAEVTLGAIPRESLQAFLARADASFELREFFAKRGVEPAGTPAANADQPLLDTSTPAASDGESETGAEVGADRQSERTAGAPPVVADGDFEGEAVAGSPRVVAGDDLDGTVSADVTAAAAAAGSDEEVAAEGETDDDRKTSVTQKIAAMTVAQRMGLAMKGSREERSILIRDPNRLVSASVLSSPKLTESEIESIAKMANVSEDTLRIVGGNRAWVKNYNVALALVRNPKAPVALSMNLLNRLNDKDLRQLSTNRNVPEILRITARKKVVIDK